MSRLLYLPFLLLTGCQSLTYRNGPVQVTHTQFLTFQSIGTLRVKTPDGASGEIDALRTDQVQALEAVAEGVAKGLAKSVAP